MSSNRMLAIVPIHVTGDNCYSFFADGWPLMNGCGGEFHFRLDTYDIGYANQRPFTAETTATLQIDFPRISKVYVSSPEAFRKVQQESQGVAIEAVQTNPLNTSLWKITLDDEQATAIKSGGAYITFTDSTGETKWFAEELVKKSSK